MDSEEDKNQSTDNKKRFPVLAVIAIMLHIIGVTLISIFYEIVILLIVALCALAGSIIGAISLSSQNVGKIGLVLGIIATVFPFIVFIIVILAMCGGIPIIRFM